MVNLAPMFLLVVCFRWCRSLWWWSPRDSKWSNQGTNQSQRISGCATYHLFIFYQSI